LGGRLTTKVTGTTIALILLCAPAMAETAPDQSGASASQSSASKAVTTITIKRCPEGYDLVTRANGRRGCAKNVLPASE